MDFEYFFKSYFGTNKSLIILSKIFISKYKMYRAFRWCQFLACWIILNMFKKALNSAERKNAMANLG